MFRLHRDVQRNLLADADGHGSRHRNQGGHCRCIDGHIDFCAEAVFRIDNNDDAAGPKRGDIALRIYRHNLSIADRVGQRRIRNRVDAECLAGQKADLRHGNMENMRFADREGTADARALSAGRIEHHRVQDIASRLLGRPLKAQTLDGNKRRQQRFSSIRHRINFADRAAAVVHAGHGQLPSIRRSCSHAFGKRFSDDNRLRCGKRIARPDIDAFILVLQRNAHDVIISFRRNPRKFALFIRLTDLDENIGIFLLGIIRRRIESTLHRRLALAAGIFDLPDALQPGSWQRLLLGKAEGLDFKPSVVIPQNAFLDILHFFGRSPFHLSRRDRFLRFTDDWRRRVRRSRLLGFGRRRFRRRRFCLLGSGCCVRLEDLLGSLRHLRLSRLLRRFGFVRRRLLLGRQEFRRQHRLSRLLIHLFRSLNDLCRIRKQLFRVRGKCRQNGHYKQQCKPSFHIHSQSSVSGFLCMHNIIACVHYVCNKTASNASGYPLALCLLGTIPNPL